MFAYLKEHTALAAVLIVCLAVIVVAVVLLIVRSRKKTPSEGGQKADFSPEAKAAEENGAGASLGGQNPAPAQTPPSKASDDEEDGEIFRRPADLSPDAPTGTTGTWMPEPEETGKEENEISVPSPLPGQKEAPEVPPVRERAETAENEKKETSGTPSEGGNTDKTSAAPKAARTKTSSKKSKNKKNKTNSKEGHMNFEDLKNAPIEDENDFYDEEDEADRIAKYSGKWVICRVVTAKPDSADIHAGENGEEMFFFELRASNGEKLLTSEDYTTYNGALGGIETHKANIARGNFKIMLSKKGDYIFKLLSGKNMLLCMGEHYATKARCESAIESTKRFARTAIIDENVQDIVITPPPEEDEDDAAPEYPDNGYNGKWIIHSNTAEDGEQVFYFELYASNGEKLLSSEEYTTYVGAINGIETHKANIARGNFRISLTKRGDYIYKLLNGNGQLLCLGEHYRTKRRCENAVESVKRFARNSPVLTDSETLKEE